MAYHTLFVIFEKALWVKDNTVWSVTGLYSQFVIHAIISHDEISQLKLLPEA